jgi:hypothetical protein
MLATGPKQIGEETSSFDLFMWSVIWSLHSHVRLQGGASWKMNRFLSITFRISTWQTHQRWEGGNPRTSQTAKGRAQGDQHFLDPSHEGWSHRWPNPVRHWLSHFDILAADRMADTLSPSTKHFRTPGYRSPKTQHLQDLITLTTNWLSLF